MTGRKGRISAGYLGTAFAAALISAPHPGLAQTVRLEDVIAATLAASPLIDLEDQKVRRAEGQLQLAQGAFDWNASAESGWERLYVADAPNGVLTNNLKEVDAWRTTLGIGRMFRSGISVQPGVTFYANTDATPAQTLGQTKARPALNLTIPLLRGLGQDNFAASNERAAIGGLEASQLGHEFATQRIVADAALVFWRCLALGHQLEIAMTDQSAADANLASLRNLAASGQAEPVVLNRALANQAVQHAQVMRSATAERLCRRDLALSMGRDGTGEPPVPAGDFPDMAGMEEAVNRLNEQALIEGALARRQDVQALARQDAAQGERVRGAQDTLLPRVDFYVDPTRVTLRLSQSLGRTTGQGQLSEAVAGQSEAAIQLRQLQTQIRLEISDRLSGLRQAIADCMALSRSAELMDGVVADAQRRYDAGVMTQQEFRQIQSESAQVEEQVVEAMFQYVSNLGALRLSTGTIPAGEGASAETIAGLFRTLPER